MDKVGKFFNYVKQHPQECCIVGVGLAVGAVFVLREVHKVRKSVPADDVLDSLDDRVVVSPPEPSVVKAKEQPVVVSKDPEVPDTPSSPKHLKVKTKCLTKKEKKQEARRQHLKEKEEEIFERRVNFYMRKLRLARQRPANPDEEYYPKEEKKEPSQKWIPVIAEAKRRLEEEDREEERKRREKFGW